MFRLETEGRAIRRLNRRIRFSLLEDGLVIDDSVKVCKCSN